MAKSGEGRLERIKEVGHGGFGVVYFGRYDGKKEVAIKVIRADFSTEAIEEANMLKGLSHRHIIQYIDIIRTRNEISLIMEFIDGTNLHDFIGSRAPSMSYWRTSWKIMMDVAHGMMYLHKQNIVHADLKSLNVLLRHSYEAVICDFGLSRTIADSKTVVTNAVAGTTIGHRSEERDRKPGDLLDMLSELFNVLVSWFFSNFFSFIDRNGAMVCTRTVFRRAREKLFRLWRLGIRLHPARNHIAEFSMGRRLFELSRTDECAGQSKQRSHFRKYLPASTSAEETGCPASSLLHMEEETTTGLYWYCPRNQCDHRSRSWRH